MIAHIAVGETTRFFPSGMEEQNCFTPPCDQADCGGLIGGFLCPKVGTPSSLCDHYHLWRVRYFACKTRVVPLCDVLTFSL